ncbi:MAG: ChaN family lipoprotein [Dissulfurispiraceae bacterium]
MNFRTLVSSGVNLRYCLLTVFLFTLLPLVGQTEEISSQTVDQSNLAPAVNVSTVETLSEVIDAVRGQKIIYVGEFHDRPANHEVQLQVIKAMHKENGSVAIGMEMFQRPSQNAINDYIEGRTDEREFLTKSAYFKKWGFDFNLYKPILDFAREAKIPVVALNIPTELSEKVARTGIDSLSPEERKQIPAEMDLSDEAYRERLREVFKTHKEFEEKNFDYFFQAQVLWDETMAESVNDFLQKNPDYQMIVLAGSGHLTFGSGIPKRTFRRNGFDYKIILNDVDVEKGIGDYIIFPKPISGIQSPKLMVVLSEEGDKLKIAGFPPQSASEKAGLKVADTILSLDDVPVKNIDDVRLQLFYKKKGDLIKVEVLRKRFLFGDKEMEFEVRL